MTVKVEKIGLQECGDCRANVSTTNQRSVKATRETTNTEGKDPNPRKHPQGQANMEADSLCLWK